MHENMMRDVRTFAQVLLDEHDFIGRDHHTVGAQQIQQTLCKLK